MEQRRNEGAGETGDPLEYTPTSGSVRHDSHLRKSGVKRSGIEPGEWLRSTSHQCLLSFYICWTGMTALRVGTADCSVRRVYSVLAVLVWNPHLFSAFDAEKRGGDTVDSVTRIKRAIASMRRALNRRAVFSSPLEFRRAISCGYNSSHPVWHALYECLQDIHGDSSLFLLQPFHELSSGFWPRLTSAHPAIQFVPKMFYRVEVRALSANIVVGVPLHIPSFARVYSEVEELPSLVAEGWGEGEKKTSQETVGNLQLSRLRKWGAIARPKKWPQMDFLAGRSLRPSARSSRSSIGGKCSEETQFTRFTHEPGSIPSEVCSRVFACGNHAERCRWLTGFPGELPFPPPLHSAAAPYPPHFSFIGSQDLDVKSHQDISTPLLCGDELYLKIEFPNERSGVFTLPRLIKSGYSVSGICCVEEKLGRRVKQHRSAVTLHGCVAVTISTVAEQRREYHHT
ncbi:hypothetical protein PR048_002802 [Dryococelus australis]|uniref:Uncharacterized protein n=1 Tax=Dryococelus australis TaxID=614101 RepID=A0ABQ9IMA4_9NEOP|nr:hypothetical protein PR048_002802 [Dryococelus australis]